MVVTGVETKELSCLPCPSEENMSTVQSSPFPSPSPPSTDPRPSLLPPTTQPLATLFFFTMKSLLAALAAATLLLPLPSSATPKAVLAHLLVGNTANFTLYDWQCDITLAQSAQIDAFVLNIAAKDPTTSASLELAFEAAEGLNFSLLFSFDYAALGAWPKDSVIDLLDEYVSSPAYFLHGGQLPLVSTFEGAEHAADWVDVKEAVDIFLVPDWTSVEVEKAVALGDGVADGLFNFLAWPNGTAEVTTEMDQRFKKALANSTDGENGKGVYMMGVAPWFFTNLPGFGHKNWLWKGDGLWDLRCKCWGLSWLGRKRLTVFQGSRSWRCSPTMCRSCRGTTLASRTTSAPSGRRRWSCSSGPKRPSTTPAA